MDLHKIMSDDAASETSTIGQGSDQTMSAASTPAPIKEEPEPSPAPDQQDGASETPQRLPPKDCAFTIINTMTVEPDKKREFERALIEGGQRIKDTEPGTLQWEVYRVEDKNQFILVEQ